MNFEKQSLELPDINNFLRQENPEIRKLFERLNLHDGGITTRHSIGVASMVEDIAKELKLPKQEASLLTEAALLHDVGKINVPKEILNKPGPLKESELEVMRGHVASTYDKLRGLGLEDAARVAAFHHAHGGYPGKDFLFRITEQDPELFGTCSKLGRLIAIADIIEASVNKDRPYKEENGGSTHYNGDELKYFDRPEEKRVIKLLNGVDRL